MGTKHGEGKRTVCLICGRQFASQGRRRTCSKSCSLDFADIRKPPIKIARPLDCRLSVNDNYVRVSGNLVRTHPVFGDRKIVRLHVLVAFDKYGPDVQQCFWCGKDVKWLFGVNVAGSNNKKIVVDHLNDVKIDNRSDNLVLSCNSCNLRRSRDLLV